MPSPPSELLPVTVLSGFLAARDSAGSQLDRRLRRAGRRPGRISSSTPAQYWSTTELQPSQEIVFIGVRIDRDHITRLLDSALLTDQEFAQGGQAWQTYPDPLPAWGVTHSH